MAVVESADAGLRAAGAGATIIQLRAPMLSTREVEREAATLNAQSALPVLVSSRCDIALAAGLAGVNLPERDIPVADARRLLGTRLVSRSVHSLEAARAAEHEGADLLIFGPVFETATHPGGTARGIEALARVAATTNVPVIAIGGVTRERIEQVLSVCSGYAAISLFR